MSYFCFHLKSNDNLLHFGEGRGLQNPSCLDAPDAPSAITYVID